MGEITRIGERSHLVNDDLGAGFENDRSDRFPVEGVHHSRGRAGPLQRLDFRGRTGEAGDDVTRSDQQRNEPDPDRPRRPRNHDFHKQNAFFPNVKRVTLSSGSGFRLDAFPEIETTSSPRFATGRGW